MKLGDYMKDLEKVQTNKKAEIGKPLCARLDGRAFHTFTRGFDKPFDVHLTSLMQETTKYLVEETNALVGYTQSDEITLVWYVEADSPSQYMFDGKYQKLCSTLAAMATGYFNRNLQVQTKVIPTFDARVWQVHTIHDVYLTLLWRERDAVKNSISALAQAHFSHKKLDGVNGEQKKKMLADAGYSWEDLPAHLQRGSYFGRVTKLVELSDEVLADIPLKHRPIKPIQRHVVTRLLWPPLDDHHLVYRDGELDLVKDLDV